MLADIKRQLSSKADTKQAENLMRFFKTGKGQYGQDDIFLGVMVPDIRQVVKNNYKDISLFDTKKLLSSKYHEERMCAVLILVEKFLKGDEKTKKAIFTIYIKNTKYINNWDLVDLSAPKIVGGYLYQGKKDLLYKFARSKNLWEKRISILATFWFICQNDFGDALKLAEILLNDKHDLMHKAVGWMLREIGKRSQITEEYFLKKHYKTMPRTMLRYAIEKFPEQKRKKYLLGNV